MDRPELRFDDDGIVIVIIDDDDDVWRALGRLGLAIEHIDRRLTAVQTTLGDVMAGQAEIDANTAAIETAVSALNASVTRIADLLAANANGVDTTAQDAAVADLNTAAANVSALVPPPEPPPEPTP